MSASVRSGPRVSFSSSPGEVLGLSQTPGPQQGGGRGGTGPGGVSSISAAWVVSGARTAEERPLLPGSLLTAPSRVRGPWHGLRNSTLSQTRPSFLSRAQGCSCLPLATSGTSYPRVSAAEGRLQRALGERERKMRPHPSHPLELPLSLSPSGGMRPAWAGVAEPGPGRAGRSLRTTGSASSRTRWLGGHLCRAWCPVSRSCTW